MTNLFEMFAAGDSHELSQKLEQLASAIGSTECWPGFSGRCFGKLKCDLETVNEKT